MDDQPNQQQPEPAEHPALAIINGEQLETLPDDLYIPPEALEVFLETFTGPLDLLLYLIKRQNIDILNIPIAKVTLQYMEYIEMMRHIKFELAADYLVMAATLAEIKSRMLLPRVAEAEEEEEDPRAELVRRLQEYERFKAAAEDMDELPRKGRDFYDPRPQVPDWEVERAQPEVSLQELLLALKDIYSREEMTSSHHVEREPLSVRERMSEVLSQLNSQTFSDFKELFNPEEGKEGIIVTFLAILELAKQSMIELVQADLFAPIHIRSV